MDVGGIHEHGGRGVMGVISPPSQGFKYSKVLNDKTFPPRSSGKLFGQAVDRMELWALPEGCHSRSQTFLAPNHLPPALGLCTCLIGDPTTVALSHFSRRVIRTPSPLVFGRSGARLHVVVDIHYNATLLFILPTDVFS
jgi:hypothetical protein